MDQRSLRKQQHAQLLDQTLALLKKRKNRALQQTTNTSNINNNNNNDTNNRELYSNPSNAQSESQSPINNLSQRHHTNRPVKSNKSHYLRSYSHPYYSMNFTQTLLITLVIFACLIFIAYHKSTSNSNNNSLFTSVSAEQLPLLNNNNHNNNDNNAVDNSIGTVNLMDSGASTGSIIGATCDNSSIVLCGLTRYISVEYGSTVHCSILCYLKNGHSSTNSLNTFVYGLKNNIGRLDAFTFNGPSIINFDYIAGHNGINEEIHVRVNLSRVDNPDIVNSPIYVQLLSHNRDNNAFFSFSNQAFVITFVLVLCVLLGILSVLTYTACEKYQKRKNKLNRQLLIDTEEQQAAFYNNNSLKFGYGSSYENNNTRIVDQTHNYDFPDEKTNLPAFLRDEQFN